MRAVRQYEFGGPEVLNLEEIPDPEPAAGEVRIAVEAAGVHLIDTRIRSGTAFGSLPPPRLPMTPGREVAGVVDRVGSRRDRGWLAARVVAHLGEASGGYASSAVAPTESLRRLPDGVQLADAVAMIGTGRTALGIAEVAQFRADDVVLLTAAAGGVGVLLVQLARRVGATVIATAGGHAKVGLLRDLGAEIVVDHQEDDWPERVRAASERVTVALDGVGGATGRSAFELVAPGGRMVVYGFASGSPMPLSVGDLLMTGLAVAPGIGARVQSRVGGIDGLATEALEELAAGRLRPLVNDPFELADAAAAHRAVEARQTVGKVVLVP